jgi:nucleoside-diphosphate-sugar epimerase
MIMISSFKEHILITGASGFIGNAVLQRLIACNTPTIACVRSNNPYVEGASKVLLTDLRDNLDWRLPLHDTSVIIHTAGMVHVFDRSKSNDLSLFRSVNVDGTINLAVQASQANIRRFIFISTFGINVSFTNQHFFKNNALTLLNPYIVSKYEAEQGLLELAKHTNMEIVIVRPPMVYGPGAPGNIQKLARLVASGLPVPVPTHENKKSLIGIENLVSFLIKCVIHPAAAGETFLISDDEDVSTAQIMQYLAEGMGRKARQVKLPNRALELTASLIGKRRLYDKIFSSLRIDSLEAFHKLNWRPSKSTREGLMETGRAFIEAQRAKF